MLIRNKHAWVGLSSVDHTSGVQSSTQVQWLHTTVWMWSFVLGRRGAPHRFNTVIHVAYLIA